MGSKYQHKVGTSKYEQFESYIGPGNYRSKQLWVHANISKYEPESNLTDNDSGQRLMALWVPELQNETNSNSFEIFCEIPTNLDEKRMNPSVSAETDGSCHHNRVCGRVPQTAWPPLGGDDTDTDTDTEEEEEEEEVDQEEVLV